MPIVLIRYQGTLEVSSTDMVVLLNIITHWWRNEELPYVRPTTIENRMGVDRRTVERDIRSLENSDLIHWLLSDKRKGRPSVRRFGLSAMTSAFREITDAHRGKFYD